MTKHGLKSGLPLYNKIIVHHAELSDQLEPGLKGGATYRKQVVNPRH